jgi:hypothetical protein
VKGGSADTSWYNLTQQPGRDEAEVVLHHKAKGLDQLNQGLVWIDTDGCCLPSSSSLFTAPQWELAEMVAEKEALARAKDKLDSFDLKCALHIFTPSFLSFLRSWVPFCRYPYETSSIMGWVRHGMAGAGGWMG